MKNFLIELGMNKDLANLISMYSYGFIFMLFTFISIFIFGYKYIRTSKYDTHHGLFKYAFIFSLVLFAGITVYLYSHYIDNKTSPVSFEKYNPINFK